MQRGVAHEPESRAAAGHTTACGPSQEFLSRARTWLPGWQPREGTSDFATALFDIAARIESEVTQRFDRVPEKTYRGFLHWLGVRGRAGQAGRVPVVFSLAPGSDPVLAPAPVQIQATPAGVDPVTFETERPLMLAPGRLADVVGVDPAQDAFYLPAAGFSSLEAPKPGPTEWVVKSDAAKGAKQLQLEPALGLDALPTLRHGLTGPQVPRGGGGRWAGDDRSAG
jgi:hypothetical protein